MKNIVTLIIVFVVVLASACLQASEQIEHVKSYRINSTGMAADVELNDGDLRAAQITIKDEKVFFKDTDEKAVWWTRLNAPMWFTSPTLTVKWYAPDGSLYKEEKIIGQDSSEGLKAELPIRGTPVAGLKGKWRVVVFHRNKLFDECWFQISE